MNLRLDITIYEIASLILLAINLYVLARTLRSLIEYTRETKRLADATVEMVPYPYVTVFQKPDESDLAVLEGAAASILGMPTIHIKNVGTGPAVNIEVHIGKPEQSLNSRYRVSGSSLSAGEIFDTKTPRNSLEDPASVIIKYETLSGAIYQTDTTIEERRWVREVVRKKAT